MTQINCDILVFIGRFQPFHIGHKAVLDAALTRAKHVIVLAGSANRSRSFRNPFTFEERAEMIRKVYPNETLNTKQLQILPLNDTLYNDDAWTSNVQRAVDGVIEDQNLQGLKVGLIGHSKDKTSYYLKLFPQWASVNVKHEVGVFNATDIRKSYFRGAPTIPHDIIPPAIGTYMKTYMMTDDFRRITAEAQWVRDYKNSWSSAPFAPTFVTVDNVVVQSGHILLVRRGGHPGKGLLALPGGFVNHDETLLDSALRELKEETKLADKHGPFPMGKLKGFLAGQGVFDDPKRSVRGYTLTHAFLFRLPPAKELMKVIGSDDAVHAGWYPIGSLDPTEVFEDHYFIINKMLDGLK
jgi:bifunctional NMN adenylyltransferase/nudix hydrolase